MSHHPSNIDPSKRPRIEETSPTSAQRPRLGLNLLLDASRRRLDFDVNQDPGELHNIVNETFVDHFENDFAPLPLDGK